MWKSLIVVIIVSLSTDCVYSQEDTTKLFYAKNIDSDVFVELGSRIRQVNGNVGMDIDFSANWLVNHKYYIGGAYGQLANVEEFYSASKLSMSPMPIFTIPTTIKYQTAGIRLGYILFQDQKMVSFSPDLTLGWAGIKLITEGEEQKLNGGIISPALKGVFNVSDYFRLGVSINYKVFIFNEFDSSENEQSSYITMFSSKSLSGLGGGIFLRIGQF